MNLKRTYKDDMLEVAFVNLYTLSKGSKLIHLNYFDRNNDAHLCLLRIAEALVSIHGFDIVIHASFWERMYMRLFHPFKIKHIKYCKNDINLDERTRCNVFIHHIEDSFVKPGAFKEIYKEYYCG